MPIYTKSRRCDDCNTENKPQVQVQVQVQVKKKTIHVLRNFTANKIYYFFAGNKINLCIKIAMQMHCNKIKKCIFIILQSKFQKIREFLS